MISPKNFFFAIVFGQCLFPGGRCRAVEISVVNNLKQDEPGSILEIENAESYEAKKTKIHFKILPGEEKEITAGNVKSFIIVAIHPNHKLKYHVECEENAPGAVKLTLLQIHNREMPPGCRMARVGHWSKRAGMHWEKE